MHGTTQLEGVWEYLTSICLDEQMRASKRIGTTQADRAREYIANLYLD